MLFLSLLICLQALNFVHSLSGHRLKGHSHALVARLDDPNDILTIGTQSTSAAPTASSNSGVSYWFQPCYLDRPIS